jgi:hypothetical protein
MRGEQPQRVAELGLRGVDPAGDDVEHEVDALGVRQPVARFLGGQQRGQEVIARLVPAPGQQRLDVGVDLGHGALHLGHLTGERADVELPLHPARPLVQPRRVGLRRPQHGGDGQRRVRLGDGGDELARAGRHLVPELRQEAAHRRPPPVRRARREGGADEGTQPPVLLALLVEDVGVDLRAQRARGHAEQVRDLPPGERRRPRPQEELHGLPVEHDERQRRLGEPGQLALPGQLGQPPVVPVTRQLTGAEIELGQVKFGHCWHAGPRSPEHRSRSVIT